MFVKGIASSGLKTEERVFSRFNETVLLTSSLFVEVDKVIFSSMLKTSLAIL